MPGPAQLAHAAGGDLAVANVDAAQGEQRAQLPDSGVRHAGAVQIQVGEVGHRRQVAQPGVRDAGAAQIERPQLLQSRQMRQPRVRQFEVGQIQFDQVRKFAQQAEAGVRDLRAAQAQGLEIAQLGDVPQTLVVGVRLGQIEPFEQWKRIEVRPGYARRFQLQGAQALERGQQFDPLVEDPDSLEDAQEMMTDVEGFERSELRHRGESPAVVDGAELAAADRIPHRSGQRENLQAPERLQTVQIARMHQGSGQIDDAQCERTVGKLSACAHLAGDSVNADRAAQRQDPRGDLPLGIAPRADGRRRD